MNFKPWISLLEAYGWKIINDPKLVKASPDEEWSNGDDIDTQGNFTL